MPKPATNGIYKDVSLVYAVGRVNQGIRRELRRRLAEWDLSVPELTALSILNRRPGLSNAQLARRTMVTPQSMIEILAELESRGLVQRTVDPDHARILRAELTPEGTSLLGAAAPMIRNIQDEMLCDVPESQREIVLDAMLKAMQRLRPGLDGATHVEAGPATVPKPAGRTPKVVRGAPTG
jgi:DNA-binding MarR family transcriptional regulator